MLHVYGMYMYDVSEYVYMSICEYIRLMYMCPIHPHIHACVDVCECECLGLYGGVSHKSVLSRHSKRRLPDSPADRRVTLALQHACD